MNGIGWREGAQAQFKRDAIEREMQQMQSMGETPTTTGHLKRAERVELDERRLHEMDEHMLGSPFPVHASTTSFDSPNADEARGKAAYESYMCGIGKSDVDSKPDRAAANDRSCSRDVNDSLESPAPNSEGGVGDGCAGAGGGSAGCGDGGDSPMPWLSALPDSAFSEAATM